jgi:hypothetical protein
MTVSQLCLALGVFMIATHGWALLKPSAAIPFVRGFHRNHALGVVFMLLAAAWLEYNTINEDLSDIDKMKPALLALFPALGIGACFVVRDFLAVRGLGAFLLMASWYVLDTIRWHDSLWRDAVSGWMYVWVIFAFWTTLSPWKVREWTGWLTAVEGRFKAAAGAGVAWGLFVSVLALTVLR